MAAKRQTNLNNQAEYNASSITVLKGLEAVRQTPGMYIGTTGIEGLHHLVWEVLDNAVDEAMAGHCDKISVTILEDGACQVIDNGRGIPVDPHPEFPDQSAAEIVLTTLHAGGKFGGGGYKVSGGLHGVGISVVNALSSRLIAEIYRDGKIHRIEFGPAGELKSPLQVIGDAAGNKTGTKIIFWPDPTMFEQTEFDEKVILERLQIIAYLNKNLEVRFEDKRVGKNLKQTFKFSGGLVDYLKHLNSKEEPLFKKVAYYSQRADTEEVEVVLQWTKGFSETIYSFANGIKTGGGGSHEEGFRKGLTSVINRYARAHNLLKEKDENFQGEDVREGLTAIISAKLESPQFQGQTKDKLGNPSTKSLVEKATNEKFYEWLEENPKEANLIVAKVKIAQQARIEAKKQKDLVRRKSALDGVGLPGKLADCSSRDPRECELFIVEGNSAGGSAKDARNPNTQAILPIRGKITNVEKAQLDKLLENEEIQALITAIGAGIKENFDLSKIRYHKVIILADADVDGSHIRALLLTFFFRFMRPLVLNGHVYVAQPPLYSTRVGQERIYLKDDNAKAEFLREHPDHKNEFQRLKGLGEMDFNELRDTTTDPSKRSLLKITIDDEAAADEICSILMGDDVKVRKEFIQKNAKDVRFLDV